MSASPQSPPAARSRPPLTPPHPRLLQLSVRSASDFPQPENNCLALRRHVRQEAKEDGSPKHEESLKPRDGTRAEVGVPGLGIIGAVTLPANN
ncbi:hypothetical protein E2C01_003710 [Portunus trituberculatus]|uniref:Uncharacterized protein n=1 Tax=Portunus trituberculatus TaxID=210409 RepID=A0A5B7CN40_PORTR|nr:hypothetical protein [Portunus trituberculatus]